MICLKVSPTSETYREETETMICLKVSPTRHTEKKQKLNNDLSQSEPHQWDISEKKQKLNNVCLKVSPTSETYREETETKQWSVSKWAPPVRHTEKKQKPNNDLSQSEPHQWDIQRRNIN